MLQRWEEKNLTSRAFFNTSAELWMNLQKAYELDVARENLGNMLEEIIPYQHTQVLGLGTN